MGAPRPTAALLRDHGSQPLDAVLRTPPSPPRPVAPFPGWPGPTLGPRARALPRPTPGRHRLVSDGAVPARRPTSSHDVLASTHRRLPPSSARTLQGGADACGVAGRPTGTVAETTNRFLRYPEGTIDVPRVSDRIRPWPVAPRRRSRSTRPEVTGPVRAARRGTTLDDVAWPVWAPPPAGRRALPGSPRERPPRPWISSSTPPATPGARCAQRGRNAGWACARHVPVEGTLS